MSFQRSLMRVITHLVRFDKDMPLTRAQVLLVVAMSDGCLVRDITQRTGLNQSTVARSLAFLGDKPVRGNKEGLHWVKMVPDHDDPRRVRCHLSDKGKQVMAELEDMIG